MPRSGSSPAPPSSCSRIETIYTCPARAAHGTQLKNYISNADLRSEDPADKWVLRAVCLLTTSDQAAS